MIYYSDYFRENSVICLFYQCLPNGKMLLFNHNQFHLTILKLHFKICMVFFWVFLSFFPWTYNKPVPLSLVPADRASRPIILNLLVFDMSVSGHVFKPCSNSPVTFSLFYSLNVAWVLFSAGLRCLRWLTGHLGETAINKTSPLHIFTSSSSPLHFNYLIFGVISNCLAIKSLCHLVIPTVGYGGEFASAF